jgi:hypothetical protein
MKTIRQAPGPAAVVIFLLGLLLLAPGLGRSAPDGDDSGIAAAPVSDAASFAGELHAAGALKFYENTEDLLRTGQFERALLRYAFLKGQIGRQPGYQPLAHQIDQRLNFLKTQLKLPEAYVTPLKASRVRPKPPGKKEATLAAPPAPAASKAQPDPDDQKGDPKPGGEAKSEPTGLSPGQDRAAVGPKSPDSQEKPEDTTQAEAEKPPSPPPSRWQRLKKRLLFWRK